MAGEMIRLGLIGLGAIGTEVLARIALAPGARSIEVVAVLRRQAGSCPELPHIGAAPPCITTEIDTFLRASPTHVVECAGHQAVRDYGGTILRRGIRLSVVSTGALADPDLEAELREAAESGRTRLTLASGAIGGLDLLKAARQRGLARVHLESRKPVFAWIGTEAERLLNLNNLREPTLVYEGSARDASLRFPQNANVASLVAVAGLGFDSTTVSLVADPGIERNRHTIFAEGMFGHSRFQVDGVPLPGNPKSSFLAALSVVSCILEIQSNVTIG